MAFYLPSEGADYAVADRLRHPAIFGEMPSSAQVGPPRVDLLYREALLNAARHSEFNRRAQKFAALNDALARLRCCAFGWDGYDAPVPNANSIAAAENALRVLQRLNAEPAAVLPSADAGVGLCFTDNDRYAHIEFLNNGEAWALMYGQTDEPQSWQITANEDDGVRQAWNRISAFLQF